MQPGFRTIASLKLQWEQSGFCLNKKVLKEKATSFLKVKMPGWGGGVKFPHYLCLPPATAPTFFQLLQ